jgi:hypothetical protein
MVYDREMGSMRTLLVSLLPRWYLLASKLVASTAASMLQVYSFLAIAGGSSPRTSARGQVGTRALSGSE